jgi:hypothetical protein
MNTSITAAVLVLLGLVQTARASDSAVGAATEIPVEKNAPMTPGHPLSSVVVTQCNLIVAVYVTMSDGRLLRFDKSSSVPAQQMLSMADTASRSERVEVSCNAVGAVGYESHSPV